MKQKNIFRYLQKFLLVFLFIISFSISASDVPPPLPPREPETPVQEIIEQKKGFKIRCKAGKCRLKGLRRRGRIAPAKINELLRKIEDTDVAKTNEPSIFKINCNKSKCAMKRKGLRRGRGKIRCKDGFCKIKGRKRLNPNSPRTRRLEAYLKRLQEIQKGKTTAPTTYKVKCVGDRCQMKRKVAGKKWGSRRHGRRRHHGGRRRR